MVVKAVPSAVTLPLGLTVTVESDSFTGPGTKITVALGVIVVVPTRAVMVLVSARAEERRAVVWPFVSVGAGLERELPMPLTVKVTFWPARALPVASFTVTVRSEKRRVGKECRY